MRPEPVAPDNRLFELDNVIFAANVAGLTTEAVYRMNVRAAQNVVDVCHGVLNPQFAVNPRVLGTSQTKRPTCTAHRRVLRRSLD